MKIGGVDFGVGLGEVRRTSSPRRILERERYGAPVDGVIASDVRSDFEGGAHRDQKPDNQSGQQNDGAGGVKTAAVDFVQCRHGLALCGGESRWKLSQRKSTTDAATIPVRTPLRAFSDDREDATAGLCVDAQNFTLRGGAASAFMTVARFVTERTTFGEAGKLDLYSSGGIVMARAKRRKGMQPFQISVCVGLPVHVLKQRICPENETLLEEIELAASRSGRWSREDLVTAT